MHETLRLTRMHAMSGSPLWRSVANAAISVDHTDITLLGLVYAFPKWVNNQSNTPYANSATEAAAAEFVAWWVSGVKQHHNLTVDWVGLFNEREYTDTYMHALRDALDRQGHNTSIVASDRGWEPIATDFLDHAPTRAVVDAISQHYPHCDGSRGAPGPGHDSYCGGSNQNARAAHNQYGVPLWSSEDYSCWTDALGAGVWATEVNSNYGEHKDRELVVV